MSLDNELATDVSDELIWDPKVDNAAIAAPARIAGSARMGNARVVAIGGASRSRTPPSPRRCRCRRSEASRR